MLLALLWLVAVTLMLVWHQINSGAGWRLMMEGAFVAAATAACWTGCKKQAAGDLLWDGAGWHYKAADDLDTHPISHLRVVADLQRVLILQARLEAGTQVWLWPDRASSPARWLDLRRAVHARRRLDGIAQATSAMPPDERGELDGGLVAVSGQGQLPFSANSPPARP